MKEQGKPGWHKEGEELYLRQRCTLKEVAKRLNQSEANIARIARENHWTEKKRFAKGEKVEITTDMIDRLWRQDCDETKLAIRNLMGQGKRISTAAHLFGFTADDVRRWMKDDEDFNRRILQAVSLFECSMTDELKNYQGRDWKPKQYLLETHEDLKDVYKTKEEDKGVQIVVNLERPLMEEMPVISVERANEEAQDVEFVEMQKEEVVKALPKPLTMKAKPRRTPEELAQARVDKHNRDIAKRRREERKKFWEEKGGKL